MLDQEPTNKDILNAIGSVKEDVKDMQVTVEFIKDNAAAKSDVEAMVSTAKSEIVTHVDGFIGLHKKLEVELVALQSKYERLEAQMRQVAEHLQMELQ
ncbi:hypothetical protein KJ910_05100 [Patescibacteria group bacterium]|nr:hypothetical protein [Patescibacteria group bacterium]MBU1906568.1 hypothetical protein [Patescibacteria group bacterium]